MEDFLQKPEHGDSPSSKSTAPWTKKVQYRSGKTPEGFAAQAEPEQVKAGFTFYDKEQKVNLQLTGFTASIVAILSGVSGTVPNGSRYDNYWSSLVSDTRDQKLTVFLGSGDNRVTVASGIYNRFKAELPEGVDYRKFAVMYIHETKECALFEMTAAFENAVKEAIAAQTGQNPAKINVFNLFELSTKFWAVRFSGAFTKRTRDGVGWNGKGDMFFYPHLDAGVVLAEKFPVLAEMKQAVKEYIEASEEMVWKAAKKDKPTPTPLPHPDTVLQRAIHGLQDDPEELEDRQARSVPPNYNSEPFAEPIAVAFPTDAPPVDHAVGALPGDDLPF
jgi:hypothetical protein